MLFRTELNVSSGFPKINFSSNVLLIGSCFTNNIGLWLKQHYFNAISNPFGTVFNPVSISNYFTKTVEQLLREHTIQTPYGFACFNYHSSNNKSSLKDLKESLEQIHQHFLQFIQKSTHVFITLGSSWVYRYKETNQIIANCQKQPAHFFNKELLPLELVAESVENIVSSLPEQTHVIFTISPVRHIKDGIIENQRSKSRLIDAVHTVVENYPQKAFYFPVYEWFMDDLRDYRFYAADLIHPNEQGINYIIEKFKYSFFEKDTLDTLDLIQQFNNLILHRPIHNNIQSDEKHKMRLNELKEKIKKRTPYIVLP